MEQQSWLTDIELNPVLAGTGKRFLNFLIDSIVFRILNDFIFAGIVMAGEQLVLSYDIAVYDFLVVIIDLMLYLMLSILFYFLSELVFQGRTIGKFITGTKAVNEDGTMPSAKTFFLRSLIRMIPFEPFSALGNPPRPWHDKWTRTYVIDVKRTSINNPAFQ